MRIRGYYFITDAALSRAGNAADIAAALSVGVTAVQYRAKGLPTAALVAEAARLRALVTDACFIVNDRVDVALAVGADGVHLGQDDMPFAHARRLLGDGKVIGVTAHSVDEALAAERQGADYVGVSPVFATATKADAGAPAGLRLIEEVKRMVHIPIVAIGGITLENAPRVIAAGADAVCAISAVVVENDVAAQVRRFQNLFR